MPGTTDWNAVKPIPRGWYSVKCFPTNGHWYLVSGPLYEVMVVRWNNNHRQVQDVMGYLFDLRHFRFWCQIKELPKYDCPPVRGSEYRPEGI